jgi:Arc/MetJ-type ribon-helix-helix transcriptional regulator
MKVTRSITIDKDLLKWLEDMVKKKEFGSVSHGIEKSITRLKEEYENRERK